MIGIHMKVLLMIAISGIFRTFGLEDIFVSILGNML